MRALVMLSLLALLCALPPAATAQETETGWVNDVLFVPLRAGPEPGRRIVHRGLRSGTPVEILDAESEDGWIHVRVNDQEGWIESQYLSRQPIAAQRLARLQSEHESVTETLAQTREELARVQQERDALREQVAELETDVQEKTSEMEQLREVAADPAALDARNQELNEQLSLVRTERDELQAENEMLRHDQRVQGWLLGLATVFAGMVLGWFFKSRGDRSRSSWV